MYPVILGMCFSEHAVRKALKKAAQKLGWETRSCQCPLSGHYNPDCGSFTSFEGLRLTYRRADGVHWAEKFEVVLEPYRGDPLRMDTAVFSIGGCGSPLSECAVAQYEPAQTAIEQLRNEMLNILHGGSHLKAVA